MPSFRGEPLGLASGIFLELWFEEVLDICLEEVRGLCLRDPWVTSGNNPRDMYWKVLGLLLREILEFVLEET